MPKKWSPPSRIYRTPPRRSRELSFSLSPSPPKTPDRNLKRNEKLKAKSSRERVNRSRSRSAGRRSPLRSDSRGSSRRQRSSAVSNDVKKHKHSKQQKQVKPKQVKPNDSKDLLDKTEIIIQTNTPQAEDADMDPSTCSFQATFKESSPKLVDEPNDISNFQPAHHKPLVRFKPTFESLEDLMRKKPVQEPSFNYMKIDESPESESNGKGDQGLGTYIGEKPTKSKSKDQSSESLSKNASQANETQTNVKAYSAQDNDTDSKHVEDERISRLEKLVELLVSNNVKEQLKQTSKLPEKLVGDFDDILLAQQTAPSPDIPELIPSNSKFTTSMWLNRIQEVCLERQLDEKTSIEFVKKKMTGIIKSWFKSIAAYDFTWPELRLLIIKTFPDNLEFATTLKLLVNRTKDASETINQYFFSKMYLCECCKITGENAVSCLIDGLNNTFTKQEIKSYQFLTPEALYSGYLSKFPDDIIEEQEKPLKMENRTVEESYDPDQIFDEIVEDKDYRMPPAPPPFKLEKKCYTCGKFGHISADCRHAPICYKCNKKGHIKAQCKFNTDLLQM